MPSRSDSPRPWLRAASLAATLALPAALADPARALRLPVEPQGTASPRPAEAVRKARPVPAQAGLGPAVATLAEARARDLAEGGTLPDVDRSPARTGAAEGQASKVSSVTGDLLASYGGIFGTRLSPASPALAVGPDHLLIGVNSSLAVLDRDGGVVMQPTTLSAFFRNVLPPGWRGLQFNPHATFSVELDKFVLLAVGRDTVSQRGYFFFAVSQTADPTGAWWLYRYDNGFPEPSGWVDFAFLGVDEFGFYVGGDFYRWSDDAFDHGVLWTFGPELAAGELAPAWAFVDLEEPDGTPASGLVPATPHSIASDLATFLVSSRPGGGTSLTLWKLTGDRGDDPTLEAVSVPVKRYRPIGHKVKQPGTATRLQAGDAHVGGAVYAFRRLWATLATDPDGDGSSSAILTVEINVDTGARVRQEQLDAGDGWYLFYPAVTVEGGDSASLDVGLVLNVSHQDDLFPSIASQVYGKDGSSAFRLAELGDAPYESFDGRWGEYSSVAYDWFQPGRMWGYASAGRETEDWRTRIVSVALSDGVGDAVPTPAPCLPDATTACLQGGRFRVEIDWNAPGAGHGPAKVVPGQSDSSVLFWFFDEDNWEVLAKTIDACANDGHFWFFAASTTNVGTRIRVTDVLTNTQRVYTKPPGPPAPAVIDTTSFSCAP